MTKEGTPRKYSRLPFSTTYQDTKSICITKVKTKKLDSPLLDYDVVKFNARNMTSHHGYNLKIFVHQKGQFLRKFGSPDFVLENSIIDGKISKRMYKGFYIRGFSYEILLRIISVDVLKKREDAVTPCNPGLQDEDTVWITNVINVLGCVPPFFKRFLINVTLSNGFASVCKRNNLTILAETFFRKSTLKKWQNCMINHAIK